MNLLKKYYKKEEKKLLKGLNQILESKIFNFLDEAELLLEQNPEKGVELLGKADTFYQVRGYDFNVECRINGVFRSYLEKKYLTPNI